MPKLSWAVKFNNPIFTAYFDRMAAVYKITNDLFYDDFVVMALHSPLEDYALVYHMNKSLATGFKRLGKDLELGGSGSFPVFEWEDDRNDSYWVLIANHSARSEMLVNHDLFYNEPTALVPRLIPELKDVDYFLKIEEADDVDPKTLLRQLQGMPRMVAVYQVETNKLKSKNNLIF